MKTNIILLFFLLLFLPGCTKENGGKKVPAFRTIELKNPILPGYFADPSLVIHDGRFYLYATADPWGTDFLSCWESDDFVNWTFHALNWPDKNECFTPETNSSTVWTPSVIKKDNSFYMYISIGSAVWCGKAEHPLGPWKNMLDGKPLIPYDNSRYYHVIDAEVFTDLNGKSYLYWGSGWDWTNGHCFAAELEDDMCSLKKPIVEVTPDNYFEAPFTFRKDSFYFLTYSEGKTIDDTYEVRYATGNSPLGPFTEAENSPVLSTDKSLEVYGPGHHTLFELDGKTYILYHRHSLPFRPGTAFRQICVNSMDLDTEAGKIQKIIPSEEQSFPAFFKKQTVRILPASVSASSEAGEYSRIKNVWDNDFATLWTAAEEDTAPRIEFAFPDGEEFRADTMEIRFEYPWKNYFIKVETSADGKEWTLETDYTEKGISGSPVLIALREHRQFIRVSFEPDKDSHPAIWEVYFY